MIYSNIMFLCNSCPKVFDGKKQLTGNFISFNVIPFYVYSLLFADHQRYHVKSAIKCMQCEKIFSNKMTLNSHVKNHHEKLNYECSYCHKSFQYKQSLSYHNKSHINDTINIITENTSLFYVIFKFHLIQ